MLGYSAPSVLQVGESLNSLEVGTPLLRNIQPYLEILEGGDETVDLEAENYRQYIHIRINNYRKTFDETGQMSTANHYSEISRCAEQDYREHIHGEEEKSS